MGSHSVNFHISLFFSPQSIFIVEIHPMKTLFCSIQYETMNGENALILFVCCMIWLLG